jgi:hypothetical protein
MRHLAQASDAPLRIGESILPIVVMDSGLALRAPRNDENSSHFREDASSDPGDETIRRCDEAIFLDLGKALKPAFASIPAAGRIKGSIMWTLVSMLYRAYCRARLLEIRKYHLAG